MTITTGDIPSAQPCLSATVDNQLQRSISATASDQRISPKEVAAGPTYLSGPG